MTKSTRRRLLVACFVAVATIPAETILLKALTSSSDAQAATEWAAGLTSSEVRQEAGKIHRYPFAYRRAIMAKLSPEERSDVWRGHMRDYLDQMPGLTPDAVAAIDAAIEAASPDVFAAPTAASRAHIAMVAAEVQKQIGQDAARYLLYRLGPKDEQIASSLTPLTDRLAGAVRRAFVALAFADECDCNIEWGCTSSNRCAKNTGCTPREEWPACGWLWNETCDGICKAGIETD
jgi:hypothetical protein